jgi:hypothetical protein
LELFETGADIRAGNSQTRRYYFCGDGRWGENKERLDLRHATINPPTNPHFTPVKDEALLGGAVRFSHICYSCYF